MPIKSLGLGTTIQSIVFDFDGTLVDSNEIKLKAFDLCFADRPEKLKEILSYCYKNHHTPRTQKFRTVYEEILKEPYTKEIEDRLLDRYAEATTTAVIKAPEIPGAEQFLEQVHPFVSTALVSSTPHLILLTILKARGWLDFFDTIQGAPVEKASWIQDYLVLQGLTPEQVVFLGDMEEDAESARRVGCRFIAVANPALQNDRTEFVSDFLNLSKGLEVYENQNVR